MGSVLLVSGLVATVVGTWRGYVNARDALGPVVHGGEPTRTALEGEQRVLDRPRVRRFLRNAAVSLGWLAIAMYGLFLISTAEAVR